MKRGFAQLGCWALRLAIFGVVAYGAAVGAVWFGQRSLIYHPWSGRVAPPPELTAVTLPVATGTVTAWHRPAAGGKPTIIFFDGNGGALVGAARFTRGLAELGYGLLLASYPGYDGNAGSPTEEGLYAAGRAALAWLDGQGGGPPVLMGYSLGAGVATRMASEHPARAVILLAPFASMSRMAEMLMPFIPVTGLLRDRYDNLGRIGAVAVPLLVIHGDADTVIPIGEGRRLFDAANEPKRFIALPGRDHVFDLEPVLPAIVDFIEAARPAARSG